MASKSSTRGDGDLDIAAELDQIEQIVERCKVLYEQYFMGIQKIPPQQLHRTAERKMIQLSQVQIRNTAQRFRLNTISQKYGSYNTYWRRTMREIDGGRYQRHVTRAARSALRQGKEMPDEILATLPKRLRARIMLERERAAKRLERDADQVASELSAEMEEEAKPVREQKPHAYELSMSDLDDLDVDSLFESITDPPAEAVAAPEPAAPEPAAPEPAAPESAPPGQPEFNAAAVSSEIPSKPLAGTDSGDVGLELDRCFDEIQESAPAPAEAVAEPRASTRERSEPRRPTQPVRAREAAPAGGGSRAGAWSRRQGRGTQPVSAVSTPEPAPARAATKPVAAAPSRAPGAGQRPPAAKKEGLAKPKLPPGMTEHQTRELYESYVHAKKLMGERTDNITYGAILKTLNKQAPKIMKQTNAKYVEFNVEIKNDTVILKAKPKRK